MSVLHMKKFMDGKMTPAEAHRALGLRKHCKICGLPAAIRIKVFVKLKDLLHVNPDFVAGIIASNPDGPFVPSMKMQEKDGTVFEAVKMSDSGFCDHCKVEAERSAARGPSWAIVEIDRQGLERSHTFAATQVSR